MEQVPDTVPVAASYQVFINHRGPDVKKKLASLIYHRLTSYGLIVFLDKNELRTGDVVSPAILGAIHSASVHLAIFSDGYAESSWCLDELYWILRSHHKRNTKIIPVFSDVEPSDLRHIKSGRYADAFEKHQYKRGVALEVLEKWKTALNQASMISGLQFKTDESDYGEILEKIVDIVLKEVFKWKELEVAKYPIGLDQAAEDFQNEILKHSHSDATTIVGIAGMGGVGKSTLAKHLYNIRRPYFSRSTILCEVRKRDLLSLHKTLLRDLLGNYDLQHIDSISKGRRILRDCLPHLPPIFIVLDDVDNMDQIESLLDVDAVASGSLIIITSRDKDLLRRSSAKAVVYDVKTLNKRHARELFCRHAFSQSKPSEEFEDLVDEFLKVCGGLPLSLKILGGLFVGRRDKEYWKRQLEKLSTTLPYEIINSLKVSYEALDPGEKEVFLDIGCFLVGEEKELAIRVLEGLHDNSTIGDYLESLRQKCLVDFHYDVQTDNEIGCRNRGSPYRSYKLSMHDQLRELARHIAREEYRVSPICNPLRISSSNDIEEMLQSQVGSKAKAVSSLQIRGIRSSKDQNPPCFMNGIRVECVSLFVFEGDLSSGSWNMLYMFGELVWLRLRHLSPSRHLSSHSISTFSFLRSMSLRRLRVLEIQSSGDSIEGFFDNFHHELPQLNELNIVYTEPKTNWREHVWQERRELIRVLRGLSGLSSIEVASSDSMSPKNTKSLQQRSSLIPRSRQNESSFFRYLEHWVTGTKTLTTLVLKNLGFLQSLPIDFSQLQNLIHLDLSGCSQLTELPNTFSKLLQLQYLALQDCFKLSIPLDILGEISTLEYVDFKGCAKLVCLPEGIPYQRNLRYLNLLGTGLLQLPNNLAILDKLQQITIGSPTLKEIPLTLANLKGLTELFLIQCPGLQRSLLEGIAAPNIKILAIDGCPIANFSFQDQGNLDVENMHLRVGMSFLRDFILTNTSISQISIPDCVAPMLETIDLSENIRLMCVNALPSALVNLNLQNCCGLKTLTSLSNLVNLKFLNINKCFNLKTLNMEGLASLEEIKAEECWELQRIEGLNQRERLNCLHISTDNRVIWNGICRFLRSPTHQQPSTAIFSGRADYYKSFDKRDMLRIAEKFNLQMLDMVFKRYTTVFSFQRLENFHSHGAILLCFNTANEFKSRHFRVTFTPIGHDQSTLQYSTITGNRGGRGVHVFMWTEKSRLFKKYSVYGDIWVICSHDYRTEEASSSSVEEERGLRGWILMVDKKTDVS